MEKCKYIRYNLEGNICLRKVELNKVCFLVFSLLLVIKQQKKFLKILGHVISRKRLHIEIKLAETLTKDAK